MCMILKLCILWPEIKLSQLSKWRCLLEDVNLNQVSEIKEAKRQMGLSNNIPQLRGGQGNFKLLLLN